jgi:PEP-CTERM putative exosortase interaction domain
VMWQESDNIHAVNVSQTGFGNFPGATVVVPEPSTLALAGLGSAALLFLRRRK